ncbi:MAG: murein biosynthesis integral membrane protein MurJ [Actinobacteria bacterium]|jgi:putative peptidoglycan lipid II flippase|nr:murein biosynthesis integral membrane protein MurJ [Actinomycetota bacterium]
MTSADDVSADIGAEVGEAARESQPGDLAANPVSAADGTMARNSAVMAAGTIVSRITGVLRDVAMTAALGFFLVSDAYSLGNSLPTVVYILVIGGALNAVFIPQLVRKMKEDADDGKAYADRLLTLVFSVLLVLSVAAVALAPWIVDLYTPENYPQNEFDLAVSFARLCLPQIFFYGLYAMLSQVLNSRGKFGAPMFAPIANNIIAIATFGLFIVVAGTSAAADGVLTTEQVLILGIGTTLGVMTQALILLPVLWRSGYLWSPRFDWRGHGLGKAGALATWTIGLVLVNQATYLLITRLATLANVNASNAGDVAAGLTTYQKAHLVFMLPHSVITVSIVTAMLPALSRVAHDGRLAQVGADVARTMRTVAALIVPVAAVLVVNGSAVAILLFGYGAATSAQAGLMGLIVSVFMLGLLPFTLFYVLLRGYYALEDTRTPFWVTVAFSVVLLAFVYPLFYLAPTGGTQVAAIALAYSIAYWIGFAITWWILARRLGSMESKRTVWVLARLIGVGIVAVGVMLVTLLVLLNVENRPSVGDLGKGALLLNVIVTSVIGLAVYVAAAWALRVREVSDVLSLVGRMARRGGRR